ncbi:uncharacterized protein FYW47_001756 [Aplochiton taeniatus]
MDTHVKAGLVFLQPQKSGKRWKQIWLTLYGLGRSGVARLEVQDVWAGGGGTGPGVTAVIRGHHRERKTWVIRLSEVVSVFKLPPQAEACPKENMLAFCVETDERTIVFSADKEDCLDWVEKLCDIAFQGGTGTSSQRQMEENKIYVSREEVSEFWVLVQPSDAATRCGLQGAYWLQVGQDALVLKEPENKSSIQSWPYLLLRRYGRDKGTFSIEAGRRCGSGPGNFTFETLQGDGIFTLIENAIQLQKDTPGSREGENVMSTSRQPRSPLPKIPESALLAFADVNNPPKQESLSVVNSGSSLYAHTPNVMSSLEEYVYSQPADSFKPKAPALNSLVLPLVPPHHPSSVNHPSPSEPVYADPDNHVSQRAVTVMKEGVYADPATVLPLKPPTKPETPPPSLPPPHCPPPSIELEPIYSEVFDKVIRESQKRDLSTKEPIYAEPTLLNASLGVSNASVLFLDHPSETLYVGARDTILALHPSNMTMKHTPADCRNYICLLARLRDGVIIVCGSYAYDPLCAFINPANFTLMRMEDGSVAWTKGKGLCPFEPGTAHSYVTADGVLYTASSTNFLGTESDIARVGLKELHLESSINRLSDPEFVSSVLVRSRPDDPKGEDDQIYWFFMENAQENQLYSGVRVARVARVCKGDEGGLKTLQKRWSSFLKAPLVCKEKGGPRAPHYNILTQLVPLEHQPGDPDSTHFYGLFTSQGAGQRVAAVCVYSLEAVSTVMATSSFVDTRSKCESTTRDDPPHPRPGQCINKDLRDMGFNSSLKLPDSVLSFAKDHPLLSNSVEKAPLVVRRGITYTTLAVSNVKGSNAVIVHLGTGRCG